SPGRSEASSSRRVATRPPIVLLSIMRDNGSAFGARTVAVPGMGWAAVGVLAFSGTVPATVFALRGFDPLVVGAGRTVVAAVLAAVTLAAVRAPLARRADLPALLVVAAGCGVGF